MQSGNSEWEFCPVRARSVPTRVEDEMNESIMATPSKRTYLPAPGRDSLLPLYDLMTRLMGAEQARIGLLNRAQIRPGHRAIDIGCGTGTRRIEPTRAY